MTTPFSRRRFLAAALAATAAPLTAQEPEPPDATRNLLTPDAEKAVALGLDQLARTQQADGSWGTQQYAVDYSSNVAVTSLAGLALMAGGNQPGRGRYGANVQKALEFIINMEDRGSHPGYLTNKGKTREHAMYNHGFATLFLAEAHGMVADKKIRQDLRATLERAVQLIINSQNKEGGWRYDPEPNQADVSVTICQIMALRSAKNAGLSVPKTVRDACIKYVKGCQNGDGGFSYFRQGGGGFGANSAFARSAAGVCALYSAGIYSGPEIDKGLNYLMQYKPTGGGPLRRFDAPEVYFYYGHYYAAQVMWTAGGRRWAEWFPAIRDELLNRHRQAGGNGVWRDQSVCDHYATAMACIILQIPNNYLPIFQK